MGKHTDTTRVLDAPYRAKYCSPRWPEGTRRYVQYKKALKEALETWVVQAQAEEA